MNSLQAGKSATPTCVMHSASPSAVLMDPADLNSAQQQIKLAADELTAGGPVSSADLRNALSVALPAVLMDPADLNSAQQQIKLAADEPLQAGKSATPTCVMHSASPPRF